MWTAKVLLYGLLTVFVESRYSQRCFPFESSRCMKPYNPAPDGLRTVHQWVSLQYDWPCDWVERYYRSKGWFDPAMNILSGIDVYGDDIFVTVQRFSPAVPAGLHKVVSVGGKSLLRPYPDLMFHELGNCSNLQYPLSIAIDPNTGYMYVIDIGKIGLGPSDNGCPAKFVVLDINCNGKVIRSHEFPDSVVPKKTNFLNDIVLDYTSKAVDHVRYAYITDTTNQQIVVFDFMSNTSWAFRDDSMATDEDRVITINNVQYPFDVPVDGIALDSDFQYVYYCSVGSRKLYQIPTSILRDPRGNFAAHRRLVGKKISNSDGIVAGQKNLYYGALSLNAVYRWEIERDLRDGDMRNISLMTESRVAQDDVRASWVESLRLDTKGYLWFTTSRLHEYFSGKLDMSGRNGPNFRINRIYVGEKSYLWKRK